MNLSRSILLARLYAQSYCMYMDNADNKPSRNYAKDYVVHAHGLSASCSNPRRRDRVASEVRSDVTCKRCLAALAKRDRAFQRKARDFIVSRWRRHTIVIVPGDRGLWDAARAIAAEEGRAL
jgi:hypothetical protein